MENEFSGLYVDRELKPLTLEEWGTLFEDFSYRLLGRTCVGKIKINTVWLGVWANGMMQPFETGIFDGDEIIEEYRHSTEAEAKDFHLMQVMAYMNKGFLNHLQKEGVCHQSPVPIAVQTS